MIKKKDVYTTGEVAKICQAAPRTVSKWIDSGTLRGYKIPGSKDRRVSHLQLIAFMRIHSMAIPRELVSGSTIVICSRDEAFASRLTKLASSRRLDWIAMHAATQIQLGRLIERCLPRLVIVFPDFVENSTPATMLIANGIRAMDDLAFVRTALGSDSDVGSLQGVFDGNVITSGDDNAIVLAISQLLKKRQTD